MGFIEEVTAPRREYVQDLVDKLANSLVSFWETPDDDVAYKNDVYLDIKELECAMTVAEMAAAHETAQAIVEQEV